MILAGLAQNTSAVITVPFHNQIVEDSGTKNVNVDIDDVVIVTCEVTYSHGATWNISNVFEQTLFGNDMLANVTQNMFTMYLMRSFPINNPEMEFNITSLLWFYVNEVEDIIQKKEITIICSNPPEGTEEDRITVRLGEKMYNVLLMPKG